MYDNPMINGNKMTRNVLIIGLAIIYWLLILMLFLWVISTAYPEIQYYYLYSACKINSFNAHREVCYWLKDH